ncbi:MAG: glycoside hydrolase family 26 protein [Oscillospiraceae bacterium]|jgi:mannan endo-1,4-beta-mannosidase|nr:glycoside hydrolase family 26 protein [Oscillospiraceae bacterium]
MLINICAFLLSAVHFLLFPFAGLLTTGKFTWAALTQVTASYYRNVSAELNDPEAIPEAKALMQKLKSLYGEYTLSGQYVSPWEDYTQPEFYNAAGDLDVRLTKEIDALTHVNGNKLPAILGVDFTGCEYPTQWNDAMTQCALQYAAMGGIITACWHWVAPKDVSSPRESWSRWEGSMNTKDVNFSLKDALADRNSEAYQWILDSIRNVAAQLQRLEDANIPVLWRPMHEASGGWFWWGADREAYLELWDLLQSKLVGEYGLHNLIWVWNAQSPDWYVGDDKCDILADDPYPIGNLLWLYPLDPARATRFKYTMQNAPQKMVILSENDTLPDIDLMYAQNVCWPTFLTWNGDRLLALDPDNPPYGMLRAIGNTYNTPADLYAAYNHPKVLNLADIA